MLNLVVLVSQSAFLPRRLITDNMLIAYEIFNFLHRKTQGKSGVAALKIDISKAYDRLEWSFLEVIMRKFGFGMKWISLILSCISTVHYHVLVEGKELGPIILTRGVRQGDPPLLYLFIMAAEGLSALIQKREGMDVVS